MWPVRRILLGVLMAASPILGAGAGAPAPALAATQLCSDAYPDFCIPPPQPDLNCEDIEFSDFAVLPPDPHRLDPDGNGRACEDSGKPRFGGGQPTPPPTTVAATPPPTTAAPTTGAPTSTTTPIISPPTVPATTTTTTTLATTPTTAGVEGMATTGIDTDRRVLGATLLVCAGLWLLTASGIRGRLRLE